jgi:glucose-6-phosphate-specific signal transduction histidine kinase
MTIFYEDGEENLFLRISSESDGLHVTAYGLNGMREGVVLNGMELREILDQVVISP